MDELYDAAFRARLLRQGLSTDEMAQFVEAVESDRRALAADLLHTQQRAETAGRKRDELHRFWCAASIREENAEAELARVRAERDTLREKARAARSAAAAPDYDEEAIRDALWAVVDAALSAGDTAAVSVDATSERERT